jgi:lysophospholipase L1-like esterase
MVTAAPSSKEDAASVVAFAPQDPSPTTPPSPEPRTYRSVLSVGDSFNGAFSLALEKKFKAEGAAFARDVWVAVALSTFARDARFANLLAKHAPDLVIVNLGANDIDDHEPEAQAKYVRRVVALIGSRAPACDCYWVAPALWKKDTGIVDVLARSVAPCRFFDSKGFKVERRGDGWHPSVDGGALWAEKFWTFFKADARAP